MERDEALEIAGEYDIFILKREESADVV